MKRPHPGLYITLGCSSSPPGRKKKSLPVAVPAESEDEAEPGNTELMDSTVKAF